jgi:hypothetical protein
MKPLMLALTLTFSCTSVDLRLVNTAENRFNVLRASRSELKAVPDKFKRVDFKNFSYPYKFSFGKKWKLVLKNGESEYDFENDRGWFNLSDVYFIDLTNDRVPEALVMIWHVSCGASCDGGAALFYVYSFDNHKLQSLWQYETGSLAYGCGLKSFTAKGAKIVLELFGRCANDKDQSSSGKFQVEDITRVTFGAHGRRLRARKREFFPSPTRDVRNYRPEIFIKD